MIKYIELDGKVPKHSFESFSTTHDKYKDAAILLNNSVVVVDFDDYTDVGEHIFKMNPTLKVHTARGFHLYYKKPKGILIKNWTKKITNTGIQVDYKTTNKAIGVIKQNNQLRDMEYRELMDNFNLLPDLPFELYPNKLNQNLHALGDGDGRNSYLFTHLLSVKEMYEKRSVFDHTTLNKLAAFINKHVFSAPLDDREFKTLLESVESKQLQKTKFLDPKDIIQTSDILAREFRIKYYNQALYFKTKGNGWISDNNKLLRAVDKRIKLKPRQQSELLKRLEVDAELVEQDAFPIRFHNDWVMDENEVIPVESDFTPFNLDVDYDEHAYDEHVDQFLDFVTKNRPDLRKVLEEMFGHILMTSSFPHKAFFLAGESGSNGKSTLLEMLNSFIGELGNTLSLEDFNESFHVATLDGKLVNIGDDIDAAYLERSKNFKTLVSGNTISVRRMYGEPFKLKNKATLIFTCNEMPTFKDKSGGIARRLVIIPCDNRVTEVDPHIDEKLSSENAKSYLLNLAIAGMERIMEQGAISYSKTIEETTIKYLTENDSVLSYINDREANGKTIEGHTVDTVYLQYQMYCEENGLKAVGKTAMGRRINSAGYESQRKTYKGKKRSVYVKVS
ncbi:phage/plasmid primase, P4 family [Terrihalobacillus insolitus]|uniref:phage/plasmid primase, P4 family n=1 Tax=Terrihalobacillus insolitus TaxID=2950438 RepID=UPI00233F8721|nr:phage/plasmid primase, P4 family [Terrihalobacillus insolitus]MDC3412543.1 phage/plasmid primase, P4 family [Terrihalobacillus insolitus]